MKKVVKLVAVSLIMGILMVSQVFAATGRSDFNMPKEGEVRVGDDGIKYVVKYDADGSYYEEPISTPEVKQNVVQQPTVQATAPVVDVNAINAQNIATNYVINLFYNGDSAAAQKDLNNFNAYYSTVYPNVLKVLQAQNANN